MIKTLNALSPEYIVALFVPTNFLGTYEIGTSKIKRFSFLAFAIISVSKSKPLHSNFKLLIKFESYPFNPEKGSEI